jgi:hypothetical protein
MESGFFLSLSSLAQSSPLLPANIAPDTAVCCPLSSRSFLRAPGTKQRLTAKQPLDIAITQLRDHLFMQPYDTVYTIVENLDCTSLYPSARTITLYRRMPA